MNEALDRILGVEMPKYTIMMAGVADQTVDCQEWIVRGDFVAFGDQMATNAPQIKLAVPKDKVLLIRRED